VKRAPLPVAIVCAAGLLTMVPSPGEAHAAPRHDHAATLTGITWQRCNGFNNSIQCGHLKVPLNYNKPNGRQITLAISLLRHTSSAKHYKGVMLSNPGGPGGEGLDLGPGLAASLPHGVGNDYDWLSWDPRGVGASRPALRCKSGYFDAPRRPYRPTTKGVRRYWLRRAKAYADACAAHDPQLLRHMKTRDSANDMESIRKALHVKKISYYGFSYGTYLGQVYSSLHPTRVKRMVLDSNVDPRRVWYQANLDQDRAFDRAIEIYFRWVAHYHRVYRLGATGKAVSHRYYKTIASLSRHPHGKLGPDEWSDAFENAGYDRSSWVDVASAWRSYAAKGRVGPMLSQYRYGDNPGDDNEFAVYNAVQCTDVQWPSKWSRWQRDNTAYNKKYPFLTWSNAWFNAPCLYWHAKPGHPVKVNGKATKSALLIDETKDAATPYEGSLEVRKLYPHSSLIAEPGGTTHADSLEGDRCVDDKIARYLRTGHLPHRKPGRRADATCKPLPDPHP